MSMSKPKIETPKYPYAGRVANYAADQGGTPSALSGIPIPQTSSAPASPVTFGEMFNRFGTKTLLGGV